MTLDALLLPLRRRRSRPWETRRLRVAESLVQQVLPPGTPFVYDAALSWLQWDPTLLHRPTRVDLFVPDYRLVIDVLTPAADPDWRTARPLVGRTDWERGQEELARKKLLLAQYGCPYLILLPHEPIDVFSLKERLRPLVGASLPANS